MTGFGADGSDGPSAPCPDKARILTTDEVVALRAKGPDAAWPGGNGLYGDEARALLDSHEALRSETAKPLCEHPTVRRTRFALWDGGYVAWCKACGALDDGGWETPTGSVAEGEKR